MNNNKVKKVYKFSTEWCAPCRVFASTFKRVSTFDEYKDIEFKSIDIENDDDGEILAEKYQVRSVPTTVLVDEDGSPIYKLIGNVSEKDFIYVINEALKDR